MICKTLEMIQLFKSEVGKVVEVGEVGQVLQKCCNVVAELL